MKQYRSVFVVILALTLLGMTWCAESPAASYPQKGKAVMVIVPFGAGGATDIQARILCPYLEKDLGTPFEVVNKPEAGSQVGLTSLAKAKPDGYTIGYVLATTAISIYLDPERKAVFNRKSFQLIALHGADPQVIAVRAESPYKSVKDLVDAARANPGKVKATAGAVLGDSHLSILLLQNIAKVKFAIVNITQGGGALITSILGGHTDFAVNSLGNFTAQVKAGELRIIGVLDTQENAYLPGVKTLEAQGYKVSMVTSKGIAGPAGTPKEVVDVLSRAIKKAMENEDVKKKHAEMWMTQRYLDSEQYSAMWEKLESDIKPLMEEARKK